MKPSKRIACIAFVSLLLVMGGARLNSACAAAQDLRGESASMSAPSTTERVVSTERSLASSSDERTKSYREREIQNPQAANFRGGDAGIYIGGTAGLLIVVLLVVLLLR